jgi:hypothetical protein
MNTNVKLVGLGVCLVAMMCADLAPEAPLPLRLVREAAAIIGVAPGGSVVRRRAIIGTAAVASSTANANAAATANANAAAAEANAAAAEANAAAAAAQAPPPAAPAGPPPVGTVVTTLPPGCATTTLNNVEYQRCGSTYYRAAMQGSNLVYVVSQP